MLTRMIRKCKCGNIMIVDVDGGFAQVNVGPTICRQQTIYIQVNCVDSTCKLSYVSHARYNNDAGFSRFVRVHHKINKANREGYRAVFCKCNRINYLSKFVVPKV